MHHKGQPEVGNRQWYRVQAKKGTTADVYIFDEIGRGFFGGGIAAEDFIRDVNALKLASGDELVVHINSPGGSVFDGVAIHNYLRSSKAGVTVRVEGVAASIASVIAMAGDRVEMPENAMMFIHNPMTIVVGNASDMRRAADELDQIRDSMASSYLRRTGDKLDRDALYAKLDAETWLSAQDCVDVGFADAVDEPVRAAALAAFDLARYGFPVPQAIASAKEARKEERRALRDGFQVLKSKSV